MVGARPCAVVLLAVELVAALVDAPALALGVGPDLALPLFLRLLLLLRLIFFCLLIDALNDNAGRALGDGRGVVLDSVRLEELVLPHALVLLDLAVCAPAAGGNFLELLPVVDHFRTAGPTLLRVVEHGLAVVVVAAALFVLRGVELLPAAVPLAPQHQ